MKTRLLFLLLMVAVPATLLVFSSQLFAAEKVESLLIQPFELNAPEGFSHLQQGVTAMLNSRLTIPGEINVVEVAGDKPSSSQSAMNLALESAQKAGADYVLYGSISLFGSYVSSDAFLLDVATGTKAGTFSRSGNSIEELPDLVSGIAAEVRNLIVFGQLPAQPDMALSLNATTKTTSNNSYMTPAVAEVDLLGQVKIDTYLGSIAAGDIDGDGQNEICVISAKALTLYRWNNGQFNLLDSMKISAASTPLGVEIVDLNGNGRAEIFITNYLENREQLSSYVVEWDGSDFSTVAKNLNWFFNTMPSEDGAGKRLIGQQMGTTSLYSSDGLFEMIWTAEGYDAGQKIVVPDGINIYGFTVGDFLQKGSPQFAQITNKQNLSLVSTDNSILWEGWDENYGGSQKAISITPAAIGMSMPSANDKIFVYLAQRVLSANWDMDGRQDVIVVRNKNTVGKFSTQLRNYKTGMIDVLSWQKNKEDVVWTTGTVQGYFSDYIYEDVTNNGHPDLVAIQIVKEKAVLGLLGTSKSILKVWGQGQ
jgi:hypothetical protein